MPDEKYCEVYGKKGISGTRQEVARQIANRFMEENPIKKFTYRPFRVDGFRQDSEGRSILDFDAKFPLAEEGAHAYALSQFFCDADEILQFSFYSRNPVVVYVNGKEIIHTECQDEILPGNRILDVRVKKGNNLIFVKCRKNVLGFQCVIGNGNFRWSPVTFYTVLPENYGQLGWNYCGIFQQDIFGDGKNFRKMRGTLNSADDFRTVAVDWMPKAECYQFGERKSVYAVSFCHCEEDAEVNIWCRSGGKFAVYIDGKEVMGSASFDEEGEKGLFGLARGMHNLSVRMMNTNENTRLEWKISGARMCMPEYIKGIAGQWLYLETSDPKARYGFSEDMLFEDACGKSTFQCGNNCYLRPVLEAPLFGRISYPVGVALYGMLRAGKLLGDEKMSAYAHAHILQCCRVHEYALWDSERYGCACVNHQMLHVSTLDDCGSFASAVLEDYLQYSGDKRLLPLAEHAGNYILHCQERLENGTFYRKKDGKLDQNTVWADDLYMSTPFLLRYWEIHGENGGDNLPEGKILDDVVRQFLGFKELLYLPEKKLMSHVYSLREERNTGIPWGRGNGWVLFSLSELLEVLPTWHRQFDQIVEFFQELSEGFLKSAEKDGMLHQVLDDPDSYREASCTAMCVAAFVRGVKRKILPAEIYAPAAERIVNALKEFCVDEDGNLYGVCQGSRFSFRREYYAEELKWKVNDTHGIGIALLAFAEADWLSLTAKATGDAPESVSFADCAAESVEL